MNRSSTAHIEANYKECIHMLNGLGKSLEKHLPESERRWTAQEEASILNTEPLNTRISRGVETMINVDSKLKRISNMYG